MTNFDLQILGSGIAVYRGQAVSLSVFTESGSRSFEAKHEPLIAILQENSTVRWRLNDGSINNIRIRSGMVNVSTKGCTVLIDPLE